MDFATQQALFHFIPTHAIYADFADELNIEDVSLERLNTLKALLASDKGMPLGLDAAILLSNWGVDEGFDYLEWFVCEQPPLTENWNPHRLRGYDDTYKHVLDSVKRYWAVKATSDEEGHTNSAGNLARQKIFKVLLKIIELSGSMPFEIKCFFWLVRDEKFTEYLPALKTHLTEILKNPSLHHWKIADVSHLLMEFEPEFVTQALSKYGKTLTDYPNK